LAVDWLAARDAIHAAEALHRDPEAPANFLLISASSRSEHTCPRHHTIAGSDLAQPRQK
jgi:hypothetical protein